MENTIYIKSIREWYMEKYPHDELGAEMNPKATFIGLLNKIQTCLNSQDVYEYIGEHDSLIRERLFQKLSSILDRPYDYVYNLWLNN